MSFGSKSLGPPTAEQLRRWEWMEQFGCLACHFLCKPIGRQCGPVERHHLTVGGKHGAPRLGHDFTIMLGAWHHRGEAMPGATSMGGGSSEAAEMVFGPSYAKTPRAFRAEFGSDENLLRQQNELIGWTKEPVRERVRRNGSPTAKPGKRPRRRNSRTSRPSKIIPRRGLV